MRRIGPHGAVRVAVHMVQLLLAFSFGAFGLVLLIYGVLRWSQLDDRPLSPARRAWILGGTFGTVLFFLVLAWWAWVAPPRLIRGTSTDPPPLSTVAARASLRS